MSYNHEQELFKSMNRYYQSLAIKTFQARPKPMNQQKFLLVYLLLLALMPGQLNADESALSEEFLEFLVDFEAADEETFELVVENGKRDAQLMGEPKGPESNAQSGELKEVIQ